MDDLKQEIIDYIELALYSAAEHVDDIGLIAKGFFSDKKKHKSSKSTAQLGKSIKKHKALISASINAIKHHQARIRMYSLEIQHGGIDHCLHGYFIEGVHEGNVGPNKIFHDNQRQVFSITSLIWEILCFILNSSRHLNKFLKTLSNIDPTENIKECEVFSKAVIVASRLPIYSFDDNHPFLETKIIIDGAENGENVLDSNIYGSIIKT